jgi:UDP-2,4-diacetamido-2,4,6-trideoxy-beta-L-altropyranose hydrolase
MKIVIRVDASPQIGTGHVMRCLALAEALKEKGASVEFICREHKGHLIERIQNQGFSVYTLSNTTKPGDFEYGNLHHSAWLGETQIEDADQCRPVLDNVQPDWLIVDHYAIDQAWQSELKGAFRKLMVIDDLSDRHHQCDLLLDQTYGRQEEDYQGLVPEYCQMLLGSQYALLRPEFALWREYSLQRRARPELQKLLITMGGVDSDNITGQVLHALATCELPKALEITVVMGAIAPHLAVIKAQAAAMPYKTKVKVDINNIAEIMANADLAIGAAGATTWERCCLGLPSLLVVLAENQVLIAKLIAQSNVAVVLDKSKLPRTCLALHSLYKESQEYSRRSSEVTDGNGVRKVLEQIL